MDTKGRIPIIETEYFLANTAYLFRLTRVSGRMSLDAASELLKISKQSICEFENCKLKLGCVDTVLRMQRGYGFNYFDVFIPYANAPSQTDIDEVDAKATELGQKLHCKNNPMPGTREDKKLNDEWAQWAEPLLKRFYERVRK